MSDTNQQGSPNAEASTQDLPSPVGDFEVTVEKQDDGWAVVKVVDGQRSVIETHPDEESARTQATAFQEAATRHDDGARVAEIPEGYPGKGIDETR